MKTKNKSSKKRKNKLLIKIGRGIFNFFSFLYRILDRIIVTPISKILLFISNIFKTNNKPFEILLNNKLFLITFSLILSLTIFFLVDRKTDLLISSSARILPGQELIANYNKEAYVVEGLPDKVDITLIGRSADLYLAERYPVKNITVDLSKCKVNVSCTVPVNYKNPVASVNYKVDPSTVTVKLYDKISTSKIITKEILNEDKLDAKYVINSIKFTPEEVYIKSYKEKLNEVAMVKALVNIADLDNVDIGTRTLNDVPLIAYNAKGEKMNVEIVPATVTVNLEISSPSKEVPIVVIPEGNVVFGKAIDSIIPSSTKITIYGTEEYLKSVSSIPVKIDVNNLNATTELNVNLTKPIGIKTMSLKTIKVKVTLGTITEKTITGLSISRRNLGSGLSVEPTSQADTRMDVIVKGTTKNINALNSDNIKVYVDLNGLKEGVHTVKVSVEGEDNKLTYVPKRETITVRISK